MCAGGSPTLGTVGAPTQGRIRVVAGNLGSHLDDER
jgi:hypothetical protein